MRLDNVKLDPDLRLKIYEKVGIYANRFSIPEPKVLLTTREVLDMPRDNTYFSLQIFGSLVQQTKSHIHKYQKNF